MLIDGKEIARIMEDAVRRDIASCTKEVALGIFMIAPTKETEQFVRIKKRKGESLGIDIQEVCLDTNASQEEARAALLALVERVDGVVLQQPIPNHFDVNELLACIPKEKDVDALRDDSLYCSPVAGAVSEILTHQNVSVEGKRAVVIGLGSLVGKPVAAYLKASGADVMVMTKETGLDGSLLQEADIIVSGAGRSGLVQPAMIKEGAVVIDAGTSESRGAVCGDVDPACYELPSYITPVPGGVGPITVMYLFKNLIKSASCAL